MKPIELQVGASYTLPDGTKFLVKRRGIRLEFNMLIRGTFTTLTTELKGENPLTYALFIALTDHLVPTQGNLTCFNLGDIAEMLDVTAQHLYKPLRALRAHDIIRRVKQGHYRMNPYLVWNGETVDLPKAMQEWNGVE